MWTVALVAAVVFTVGLQYWFLYGFGRRKPVGDETEYLERAVAADPYAPEPFLRPPGMAFLARLLRSEPRLRGAMAWVSCLATALVATAAWLSNDSLVALLAVLLFMLPERLIHACHIWPDSLLAAVMAGVVLMLSLPDPTGTLPLAALGALAMLGALIRVDSAALAPLCGIGLAVFGWELDTKDWLLLLAPTILAVTLWAWRNGRRYGRRQYDDTWAFNVMLAGEQAAMAPILRDFAMQPTVEKVARQWRDLPVAERATKARRVLVRMGSKPLQLSVGMARRALTFVGPDTFVRQMLLAEGAAYPELSAAARRRIEPFLRQGFPLLVTACLFGTLLTHSVPPVYALPTAGTLLVGILFHLRTRYRVVVMPVLAVWAADVSARSVPLLQERSIGFVALYGAVGLGVFWLLGRVELGREIPDK